MDLRVANELTELRKSLDEAARKQSELLEACVNALSGIEQQLMNINIHSGAPTTTD